MRWLLIYQRAAIVTRSMPLTLPPQMTCRFLVGFLRQKRGGGGLVIAIIDNFAKQEQDTHLEPRNRKPRNFRSSRRTPDCSAPQARSDVTRLAYFYNITI